MPDESFPHGSQLAFFGSTTSVFTPCGSLRSRTTQFFLCALLVAQLAVAQQDPTISVNVKVVNLPVTVRDKHNAGYHKIQLTVKRKDLTVQTKDGYYAEE
jgi:hypothetical protein